MTIDRREFLQRAAGMFTFATVAGLGAGAAGCQSQKGVTIPPACPAGRDAVRVLSTGLNNQQAILWESTRELPAGNWTPMAAADFIAADGFVASLGIRDIDEIAVPVGSVYGCLESHVLFVAAARANSKELLLYQRQRADGSWTPVFNLSVGIGGTIVDAAPFTFARVAAARVGTELHVCGVSSGAFGPGILLHGIRPNEHDVDPGVEDRAWSGPWQNVGRLAGVAGPVVDVACAGVADPTTGREDLHVCVITNDGRLWHAVRNSETMDWTQFADAGLAAGNRGHFRRVDCTSLASQLHLVAVTSVQDGGKALYTIRNGVGAWRGFEDVIDAATTGNGLPNRGQQPHNVSVAFCNGGLGTGDWRLYVLIGALYPETLGYTIHSNQPVAWPDLPQGHADSTWKPWSNLLDESGGGGTGGAFGNENTTFSVAAAELH